MSRPAYIIILILLTVSCTSCRKTEFNQTSPVPVYNVNFSVDYLVYAPDLLTQGGLYVVTEPLQYGQYIGFSGLVIFHGFDDRFYAYDLCCPHECNQQTRISPSSVGTATCPKCGSVYDIGFGTGRPTSGPSSHILRRYTVTLSGSIIHVTN